MQAASLLISAIIGTISDTATNLPTMEVAQAVMASGQLDFGAEPPGIAPALREIERRYQPDDGQGRTFTILEAFGEPMPDGKLPISFQDDPVVAATITGLMGWPRP